MDDGIAPDNTQDARHPVETAGQDAEGENKFQKAIGAWRSTVVIWNISS
jgi:hypothetical protein